MNDLERRLENILNKTEKLISLHSGLNRKVVELESANQQLKDNIKSLEEQILKLHEKNQILASEQQKITNQKQREITHKINDLLNEVERCISRINPTGITNEQKRSE